MKETVQFSVIIPVFNQWELTRNCLASLHRHTDGHVFEVIVVDNGSGDETASGLESYGKGLFGDRFTSIVFTENRNFGPASNAGAAVARAPLLLFLNNDTVVTPGWAAPLLDALAGDNSLGAVGPLLLYGNGTVQHLGVAYSPLGTRHLYMRFPGDHALVYTRRNLQFITAACMMMPKALFFACGQFYEGYRNGFEDTELCVRIRERGKRLGCITSSVVYHLESRTPGRKQSETANGELLQQRCGRDIFIDVHHHAARDGLTVAINDFMGLSMLMKPEDERALLATPMAGWPALAEANPLWLGGRKGLADHYEAKGDYARAMALRVHVTEILPTFEHYRQLAGVAPQGGCAAAFMAQIQEGLEKTRRYRTDAAFARLRFRMLRRHIHDSDTALEALYRDKLKEWFG